MYFVHVYIFKKKNQKKKFQDFQIFPKKREKFSKKEKEKKKSHFQNGTRGSLRQNIF